jgi:outer membrane protein assembly factor BamB
MTNKNRNRKVKATSLTALLASALILSALAGVQFVGKVYADYPYDWPMARYDLQNTGYSESPAPNTNQTLWTFTASSGIICSAAVVNGRVYIGDWTSKIYCLDHATGALIWNYTCGGSMAASPAVVDGKVYTGSGDFNVYCLDAVTGEKIWNYTTGDEVYSSPAVVDGKVYVGSDDDNMYCLDADTGAKIWNYTTGDDIYANAPAVVDGKVYVGSNDDNMYCLDADTGAKIWNYTTGDNVVSMVTVADGRVFAGSDDDNVYCWNAATGALIWNYTTGGDVSHPGLADGKVYIGSFDRNLYCLNATTGAQIWNYTTGNYVVTPPSIADGKVYFGSFDRNVYCLDAATGDFIWSYTTTGGSIFYSSPAIANGVVYVAAGSKVYAFSDLDAPIPAPYDWDVGVNVGDTFRYKGTLVLWESENASFPPMASLEYLQPWNESDWLEYKVTDIEELIVTFEVTTRWKNGTETVDTLEENMTSTIPIAVIGANLAEGTEIRPEALLFGQPMPARCLNASIMREYESGSKETNVIIFDWNFFAAVYHFEYLFDKETGIKVYFQSSSTNAFDTSGKPFSYNCTLELIETNVEGWTVIPEFPTGTVMLLIFVAVTVSICILRKPPKRKR